MRPGFPLSRIRLELDRPLRTRFFFGRAIRGNLECREYMDLLNQLGGLVGSEDAWALDLQSLDKLNKDLRRLGETSGMSGPFTASSGFGSAVGSAIRHCRSNLPDCAVMHLGLSALGTSWTLDAAEELEHRFPESTSFLQELGSRGAASTRIIQGVLSAHRLDPVRVYMFAELIRGGVLGVATYLDFRWPAPAALMAWSA